MARAPETGATARAQEEPQSKEEARKVTNRFSSVASAIGVASVDTTARLTGPWQPVGERRKVLEACLLDEVLSRTLWVLILFRANVLIQMASGFIVDVGAQTMQGGVQGAL